MIDVLVLGAGVAGATAAGLLVRAGLSLVGVEAPKRFERTPIYFKELRVVGSNAFGAETFRGVRKHAMEHCVDLCATGEVDLGFLVVHGFALADWKSAFATVIAKTTGCVKVAFASQMPRGRPRLEICEIPSSLPP